MLEIVKREAYGTGGCTVSVHIRFDVLYPDSRTCQHRIAGVEKGWRKVVGLSVLAAFLFVIFSFVIHPVRTEESSS